MRKADADRRQSAAADPDASVNAIAPARQSARAPDRQLVANELPARFVRGFFVFTLYLFRSPFCVYSFAIRLDVDIATQLRVIWVTPRNPFQITSTHASKVNLNESRAAAQNCPVFFEKEF